MRIRDGRRQTKKMESTVGRREVRAEVDGRMRGVEDEEGRHHFF